MIATRATISEGVFRPFEPGCISRDYLISTPRVRFFPVCSAADDNWLEQAQQQLVAIGDLKTGWDSHGAAPPESSALRGAWSLLVSLHKTNVVPKPRIYPSRDGGIQFEWELGSRYLEIELLSDTEAAYFYSDSSARFEVEGDLHQGESIDEAIGLICRVMGP